ncbi:PRM1 Plasma membrane fusion protein PRM1 [Candida maltosa Xu316]|uniref:Plasma membrane fusion protein PRM1 n=1 Tax=Candida maltosa (strain Xu316) TaxID=1245528 RepID=M3JC49_CANMX|nr:Plasma membrane fusion protein PRM1 [Candida maltosa Xu316]
MFRNYLNLPEQLTQVYLNKYTVVLLIILIKLLLLQSTLVKNLSKELLNDSICNDDSIQPVLNTMHNMIIDNVQKMQTSGILAILLLLHALKHIAIFVVDLFLGTYLCLLNAFLKGTTDFALDSTESVIRAVNITVVAATNEIEEGLLGISSVLNDMVTGFNSIVGMFSGKKPDVDKYRNMISLSLGDLKDKIMIPGDVLTKIDEFRETSLDGVEKLDNGTQMIVASPFEKMIKGLDSMRENYDFAGTTPPEVINYREVCLKEMEKLKDVQTDLVEVVEKISKWIFIGLLLAMVGSIMYVSFIQWRKWKRMEQFIHDDRYAVVNNSEISLRNKFNIYDNFLLYTLEKRLHFNMNGKVIWILSYMFSKIAQNVFFFGMMGVISVILQFVLVNSVQSSLNNHNQISTYNNITISDPFSAATYIKDMNNYINETQNNVNQELFGNIKEVSVSLNTTIVTFLDDLNSTLQTIFGSTPLSKPITTIVYCTLGRKLEKVESGLTWMNDNLNIEIPLLSKNMQDDLTAFDFTQTNRVIIDKANDLLEMYKNGIWLELYISLGMLGGWLVQVLFGVMILVVRYYFGESFTDEVEEEKRLEISNPYELTEKEKQEYGYPLSNPREISRQLIYSSSSYYPSVTDR